MNQPSIFVNQTSSYTLPAVTDKENDLFTINLISPSPAFASYDPALKTITFSPTLISHIGTLQSVTVEVKDANLAMIYSFYIGVLNRPPRYVNPSFTNYADVFVSINTVATVLIPAFNDPDGSAVTAVFTDTFASPVPFTMAADYS